MSLVLIAGPSVEPFTRAEAKLHLKVEHTADDTLIDALITAARQAAEHELGRSLLQQTWELVLDEFPPYEIKLARPPVLGISSVTYVDTASTQQVLAANRYVLDKETEPGYLLPALDTSWPSTLGDTTNAVRVQFTAGYGAQASAVPASVRQWMLLQIGAMYRNREAFATGPAVHELPNRFVDRLLDGHRFFGT